jgi:magnesium chelatase family protein
MTILPARALTDALETTCIRSVAGRTGARTALVTTRPWRAPHHTIAAVGLIGGGQVPLPGEESRAHHGILWLDELPACRRHELEGRRQPLEEGVLYRQSSARHRRLCADRVGGAREAFASRSHPVTG